MHKEVLNLTYLDRSSVDHRDGNGLNNQKYNLRKCFHRQNMGNQKTRKGTSKYKGVSWKSRDKVWAASICSNYKVQHIGHFTSETEAAKAYDKRAIELFGEFVKTNF